MSRQNFLYTPRQGIRASRRRTGRSDRREMRIGWGRSARPMRGGISAILAAAISARCLGLILLDPPFYLHPVARPSIKRALFHRTTKSRIDGLLSDVYDQLKKISLKLHKNAAPRNANFALLKRWKNIAGAGMPILLLNAPEPKAKDKHPRAGKFDCGKHILDLAGSRSRVDARIVAGANHTFSNPSGKAAVREHVAGWMAKTFPSERSAMQAFVEKRRLTDRTPSSGRDACAGRCSFGS